MIKKIRCLSALLILCSLTVSANPFPPDWVSGTGHAIHHSPAPWPSEPANAADCGASCGEWKAYTRFQNSVNDPRAKDDSNGGTAPQNYVNIASSCVDKNQPSVYYYLHQGANEADDVIMFRWRVEQIANTYATGPGAGSYGASNPWNSALWTVLFDIDGSGYRSLAAHLNGSSGSPAQPIDMLAGIWSQSPKQSIDYINDPSVHLLGHNPTAFIDQGSGQILNFQSSGTPVANWPNGSSETSWDYGTTRARLISTRSCTEYFVDYQIPVAMLDATGLGGPKITRSTPMSMMFCTANSLNNPFQKDCAINKEWAADSNSPAPFGDYISFDKAEPYSQPIVAEVTAIAPSSCGQDYQLTTKVQDVLALVNGEVQTSVKAVDFYYWYDANDSGDADDVGGVWVHANSATQVPGSINSWSANWNSSSLPKGRYLIGVQAVDDNTLVDNDMIATGIDNRTFSYVAGNAQSQVYIDGAWITGQQTLFPEHSPGLTPAAGESWYGNPDVTGIQTALVGMALNTCGVAPALSVAASNSEVAPAEAVSFTITVSNAGNPNAITVSSLTNVLPDGFSYQNNSTGGDFGIADLVISGQSLIWSLATPVTVLADGSAALSFIATASSDAGNYNNTATASTSFGDLASDPVAVAVGSARLALSITPDSYSISPGGQVSYTLNYSNPSTVSVDAVILSTTLPANTTFQSCSNSCSGSGTISWSLATLNPGASGSVSLVLDIDSGYVSNSLTALASLSATDPAGNPVSASAQSNIFVNVPVGGIAAFTLEKTADAIRIAPAGTTTFTISYNNYGGASASDVVITDTLPEGMSFVSCTGGCIELNGIVSWSLGTVVAGLTGSVAITATAADPFTFPNPALNTASINWTGGTAVLADAHVGVSGNYCSATFYFGRGADDVLATIRPASQAPPTKTGDYTTTLLDISDNAFDTYLAETNQVVFEQDLGLSSALDISGQELTINYYLSAEQGGARTRVILRNHTTNTDIATSIEYNIGTGATSLYTFTATVPVSTTINAGDQLRWYFQFRAANTGKDITFHYDSVSYNSRSSFCSASSPASLVINKKVDPATVPESTTSNVVYSIDFANTGGSNATGTSIVDMLPAGVSFTSATLNGSSITPTGSNPYIFTVDTDGTSGTAVAGNSGILLINASVSNTATGLLTNTASLSSDQTSAVSDSADILVGAPVGGGGPTAPELYVGKVASASLLGAGDTVTYNLTVVNTGSADATNVVITDDFLEQAYFTYLGCTTASGTCSEASSGILSWSVGTLAAGASATLNYQMQTATTGIPNGLTLLSNAASVVDDAYCAITPPPSCSSGAVDVWVSGNPELALLLTADNAAVEPGDSIEYTLLLTNNGSSTANDLLVANPIPDNTGFVEITLGTGSFDSINNQLVFTAASLAAGASTSYSFIVQVGSPLASGITTLTDTATGSAANAASVSDSVTSIATAAPVMSVDISGAGNVPLPATTLSADASNTSTLTVSSVVLLSPGDIIRVNGSLVRITAIAGNLVTVNANITASTGAAVELVSTYSITYQNTGNADATNVQISEPLPAGWLYVSASPGATSAPTVGSNGAVSWTLDTVAAGGSGTLQFVALPTASGSGIHTVTLTGDGGINEQDTVTSLVGGLTVEKSAVSSTVEPGGSVSYIITLNNSLAVPVTGVQVKDLLPAGFNYDSATPVPDSFENADSSRPIWIIDVSASGSASITLNVIVDASAGASTYQNEVEVVAPAGVGVVKFDALATGAEDVTLLAGTGLISGYVYYGSAPLAGVWLNFYENNVLAYKVYTDDTGRYQSVLEAGSNWRLEISSDTDNDALLAGLSLTTGTDPENFAIITGDSLTRSFVYALTAPTVNSQITNDTTPTITGTYPSDVAGGVFSVTVNGISYGPGADLVVTGDDWTLNIPVSDLLADGSYEVIATITAGNNSSSDISNNELVIDTVAPAAPTVNSLVTAGSPILTGTAILGSGETLSVTVNGATYDNVTVTGGIWSIDTSTATVSSGTLGSFVDGASYDVTTAVTDAAGNVSVDISSGELQISSTDTDGDGIPDTIDLDDDNDGIPDVLEGDGVVDTDGDGIADSLDLDSDNDGLFDLVESGAPDVSTLDADDDGQIDGANTFGSNGLADTIETSADSGIVSYNGGSALDTDGDGVEDYRDLDSDNDGIPDVTESGGSDPDGDGIIGTGIPIVNANGLATGSGLTPADSDGDGIGDQLELDSDNDGLYDLVEAGGNDSNNDGLVDGFTDINNDGFDDGLAITALPLPDTDGDGIADYQDYDDADNDGIQDSVDLDDDNDGIPDVLEGDGVVDTDGDGIADSLDLDSDNDGLFDLVESGAPDVSTLDVDDDGQIDGANTFGSNGLADTIETSADSGIVSYNGGSALDTDGDGVEDYRDLDSDNDGIPDVTESGGSDPDGDGIIGAGTPTVNNHGLANLAGNTPVDTDGDGVADQLDLDADNDGEFDLVEAGGGDSNNDGLVDDFTDADNDGFDDALATTPLPLTDTDGDGIPDYLDTSNNSNVIRTGVDGIGIFNLWWLMLFVTVTALTRRGRPRRWFLLVLLLPVLLSTYSASADEDLSETFQRRIYIGAGLGYSLMAPETDGTIYSIKDENDFSYKVYIGFDLNEYLSSELSMSDLGTTELDPAGEIDYSITAFNVLYYFYDQDENDHQGWASYIKAGLGSINNSATVPYQKENSVQVSMGAGIEYAWKNGFATRLDFESFDDDASLVTVGMLYRFGEKQQKKIPPKDSDQDGISDKDDQCRETPVDRIVDADGCELDSDKDGIVDSADQCPETPEGDDVDEQGCSTDNDSDGVANETDQCPDTVKGASVNAVGCAIFETSLDGVNFETGSADLTEGARQVLDKAAEALMQITTVRVEVQAHTDSVGKKQSNQTLSDARAKSVADYLESKGVERSRMETKGYGETVPRASNETPESRAQNRRVEFRVLTGKHLE